MTCRKMKDARTLSTQPEKVKTSITETAVLTPPCTLSLAGSRQPGYKLYLLGRACSLWPHPALAEDYMYLAGMGVGK